MSILIHEMVRQSCTEAKVKLDGMSLNVKNRFEVNHSQLTSNLSLIILLSF